ncbi:PorP/SprF family type IX secretion system membrane protein [Christiangramia sabulilitoris]|uniref:Type IX secretion system membrane protein PorP/SprF n=1 Tax=Christiangramia sabulilitoris TaxID=2583991 RepID=A0A550I0Q9_9FLAO|nr:type IX secretion system membrane protein PorP/SprF [Christiangramia sabulilitoris]TRO64535.1 type IX secretion system membrane protein PorP/SprF [Christiangramia sabulilitoris]
MKKYFIIFIFLIASAGHAQQDAQYTQYMYNTALFNPAYVGSEDFLKISGVYRSQWVGLDGAPETLSLSINNRIGKNVGLGGSIISDKIGPSSETIFNVDFSYTLDFEKTHLAFGLKAGANILNVDFSQLTGSDEDVIFQNNIDNRFTPNVGVGAYYYSDNYYIGLSVPQLLETNHYERNEREETFLAKERFHTYFMGGYVFNLSNELKMKPAYLLKLTDGAPLQLDLSANFLFMDKFTLGASYRLNSAVSALAGLQILDNIFVGYSYDADTTALRNYNSGSHEIVLKFDIANTLSKYMSPRFF